MRVLAAVILLAACSSPRPAPSAAAHPPAPRPSNSPPAAPPQAPAETLAADTPATTTAGNPFIAPAGWSLRVQGPGTILEAPERGSVLAIYDLADAKDADAAVAQAWRLYKGTLPYAQKASVSAADSDGWTQIHGYDYVVSPNEQRIVAANARLGNGIWTVVLLDMAEAVAGKRGSQIALALGKLVPKGRTRESFAGKPAHVLDAPRVAALRKFVEDSVAVTHVPGVSFGIVQAGAIVYAGGVGVRDFKKPAKVGAGTKYMIASNTKALTTLMLAKLVDAHQVTWETQATSLLPTFKLGDAETTNQVLVKHLICACTGLPRQDLEWLFQWDGFTPEKVIDVLGTMQPTSKFGELFQYSNLLAAAAGYIGGHVAYPALALGPAYDRAMQRMVLDPLGMASTTFDYAKGQRGDAAVPHATDIDGKPAYGLAVINTAAVPVRPAGAAWSNINDLLKYVQMELAEGGLPGGKRYIARDALLARRAPQVAVGTDATYGMGLLVDKTWGVPVVHHGGALIGFHSDMMWLPDHGVGAVVLANGDPGWLIASQFQRKLLEVLFDGAPQADASLAAAARAFFDDLTAERKLLAVPAAPEAVDKLAARYHNASLGEIAVRTRGPAVVFDFGEYASEMATKTNPDGTVSFVTIAPGAAGIGFVVGNAGTRRTLTLRDPQHEYVFTESPPRAPGGMR